MKRKYVGLVLAIIMLISFGLSNVTRAAGEVSFQISKNEIVAGKTTQIKEKDNFTLRLSFSTTSSTQLEDLYLVIDTSKSFYGPTSNVVNVPASQLNKATSTVDIPLAYSGSGDELSLTFKYRKVGGETGEAVQSLSIASVIPTDTPVVIPPGTVDSSKYVPRLSVSGSADLPVVQAGTTFQLKLPIKNSASDVARNISVTLEAEDKSKIPFQVGMAGFTQSVEQIKKGETQTVEFALKIKPEAATGTYALKLNYQFNNIFGDPFTSSETIYIKVENNNTTARLSVSKVETSPQQALPGGKVKLTVTLINEGSLPVSDVKMMLAGLKSDGFALDNSTDVRRIAKLAGGGTKQESFNLTVSNAIAGGSQPLSVKWDYKDESGTLVTEESQIFIPVNRGQSGAAALTLDNIKAPTGTLVPTNKFSVTFNVKNAGKAKAENVKVSLTSDKELVPTSLSTIIIPALAPGETKALSFSLSVAPDAVTKNYPVSIAVEYDEMQTGQPVKVSLQQYVGVYVEGKTAGSDEDKKSVPRIIINKYSLDPASVLAGQDFKLALSFLNTSKTMNVRNVKVTAASDDGIFTVDGSNTFFTDSISVNSAMEKTLILRAKPDAEPKMYALTLNFEYEDDKGNPFTTKETVSIPVMQNTRLTVGELTNVMEAYVGQPIPLSVNFYNMGKAILYNLMVTAEGDFQSANASYYVGNFASGRSDSMETSIIPNAAGELTGEFVFAYEDAAGKSNEIRKPFKIQVNEMPPMEPMPGGEQPLPENPGGDKDKWKTYLYIGIPALLVIGGGATALTIRRKRRKRKEMDLDDEI